MSVHTCDECGSDESVTEFYGRETCDKQDKWYACWECRKPYIMMRVHPEDERDEVESVEDEQTGLGDYC